MVAVFVLTTAAPYDPTKPGTYREYDRFMEAAAGDTFRRHKLTESPEDADIILYIHSQFPNMSDILNHDIYKLYKDKCYIFHMGDRIIPYIPGVYTCIEKWMYLEGRTRTGHYMQIFEAEDIQPEYQSEGNKFLYSFVGSKDSSKIRSALFESRHDRVLIIDTKYLSSERSNVSKIQSLREQQRKLYIESLKKSSFVLCPRGFGSSTFRLFEAMKAGRPPVIISDQWVPPIGPTWEEFSFSVREDSLATLQSFLSARESNAIAMGKNARATWEQWFSKEATFHRVVEWCLDIKCKKRIPDFLYRTFTPFYKLHPYYLQKGVSRRISNRNNP